jgi:hypothetical protein
VASWLNMSPSSRSRLDRMARMSEGKARRDEGKARRAAERYLLRLVGCPRSVAEYRAILGLCKLLAS